MVAKFQENGLPQKKLSGAVVSSANAGGAFVLHLFNYFEFFLSTKSHSFSFSESTSPSVPITSADRGWLLLNYPSLYPSNISTKGRREEKQLRKKKKRL